MSETRTEFRVSADRIPPWLIRHLPVRASRDEVDRDRIRAEWFGCSNPRIQKRTVTTTPWIEVSGDE